MIKFINPFNEERLLIDYMKSSNQKTSSSAIRPVFERIEKMHPFKMINYLVISASCLLYAVITFFFIRFIAGSLRGNFEYPMPKFFVLGAIILIVSTHFTFRLHKAYTTDSIPELRKLLSLVMISGLLFFLIQLLAWMEILKLNLVYDRSGISDYLFVFSGVHFTYVLAGMVMAAILFYHYMMIENDPVKTLITTTNPHEKLKLDIFVTFWNFTVYSWSLIFGMLLFIL